ATFRCAFTLSFASGSGLMPSDETLGSIFRADCWRRACVCRGYSSWSSCVPGPVGRSLVPGVDCVGGGWDPRRRDPGAPYCHGNHVVCGIPYGEVVVAAHLVHHWTCRDGWLGSSAAEFVSLPCDLDIATLDTRYRARVANTVGRVGSNSWRSASISAQFKCAAMGCRAFPDVIVARVPSYF